MENIVTLKTVNIEALSRKQLEAAYIRLLKVSEMKTRLISFLEKSTRKSTGEEEFEGDNIHVQCPSCDFLIHGRLNTCPACRFDFGFDDFRCRCCGNSISVDSNICPYCFNNCLMHNSKD